MKIGFALSLLSAQIEVASNRIWFKMIHLGQNFCMPLLELARSDLTDSN